MSDSTLVGVHFLCRRDDDGNSRIDKFATVENTDGKKEEAMENEVSPIAAAATDDTNKMKKKALPHQQEIVALISDCIKIRNGADNLMYMSVYAFQKMGKKLGAWGGGDKYYVDEASALPIMLLHNGEQSNLPDDEQKISLLPSDLRGTIGFTRYGLMPEYLKLDKSGMTSLDDLNRMVVQLIKSSTERLVEERRFWLIAEVREYFAKNGYGSALVASNGTADGAQLYYIQPKAEPCECDDGACLPIPLPTSGGLLDAGGGGEQRQQMEFKKCIVKKAFTAAGLGAERVKEFFERQFGLLGPQNIVLSQPEMHDVLKRSLVAAHDIKRIVKKKEAYHALLGASLVMSIVHDQQTTMKNNVGGGVDDDSSSAGGGD